MDDIKLSKASIEFYHVQRRELWIQIAVAVARSTGQMNSGTPAAYANKTLDYFDVRFGKLEPTPEMENKTP